MYAGHTPFYCIGDYKLKLYYLLPDELELLVVEEVVLPVVEAFVLLVAAEVLLPVVEVFALPVVEALLVVEAGVLVALVAVSFFPHPVTSPAVPTASTRAAAKTNFVFFIFLISFFVFVICFLKITVIINSTMRLKSQ